MNIYKYGFVLFFVLLLSACGGGGGGGGNAPPGNTTLTIAAASDAPPPRVIAGTTYQEVFAFTVSANTGTKTVTGVSVPVSGNPALVAALSVQLTNSGTPIGSVQQVSGGRALFSGLSVNVTAGTVKRLGVLAAVTGNVLWDAGERTKKVSFSISHGDVVPEGAATVIGSATGSPMYRERGRIVFPLGVQVNTPYGLQWSSGVNIWIGDMETLVATQLTDNVGDYSVGYIRHGMTLSPSSGRIAFTGYNSRYYQESETYGVPASVEIDGTNPTTHLPWVCQSSGTEQTPTYTPDGTFIVYSTKCNTDAQWRNAIVAVRTDGSRGFKITSDTDENYSPVVSSDGMAVYYLSCTSGGFCKVKVIGVSFSGGYATGTPWDVVGSNWNWTPVDHGDPTILYPGKGTNERYLSLSPDGKKLLVTFKKNNGPNTIGIYDIAGNTMTEVGEGRGAYWAKDGRIVFFKPSWAEKYDFDIPSAMEYDSPIPAYFMEGDGSNVREVPVGICLGANWLSCAFGLPLLPPL